MLPERVVSTFHEIRRGSLFPFAWLSTVGTDGGPRVRTVRLCGFNLKQALFYVGSSRRHFKREQLQSDPRAELCVVELEGPLQLRFSCGAALVTEDGSLLRKRFWCRLGEMDQRRYYGLIGEEPPPDFMLIALEAREVDLLDLRPQVPIRVGYRLSAAGSAEELRPV